MFKRFICWATVALVFGWGGPFALGQENQIQNGEFDDDLNSWGLYGGAGFAVSVVQNAALSGYNAAMFDVTNAGAGASIGIAQSLQCEQGQTYKIGLTAKASQPREMVILMQLYTPAPSWTDVFMVKVPLTTKAQTFVYEYTHTRETTSANAGWSVDVYYMLKGQYWPMIGSDLNCKVWLDRVYVGQEPPAQYRYRAAGPNPADGVAIDKTLYTLQWIPGDFAVSHAVYFSDNFDDVNETGVAAVTTTRPSMTVGAPGQPYPEGLTPGTTYYWRVDEVNDTNPDSPWKGDVWSLMVRPRTAWQPSPADGAELVRPDQVLTWEKGLTGFFHTVYLGESFDEVHDATTGGSVTIAAAYDPGMMQASKTYFWRVDTFDGINTHTGQVWSFTTVPDVAITDPDLAGWWTLDEGRGTTAIDSSGHGGHGILVGGPQWTDGIYGGALSFTGTGQYVNCGTGAADITGDFTLATWIKMAPANSGKYMGIAGRLNGVYQGFGLVRHSSDVLRMWVGDGSSDLAKSAVSSDATYADTEWHHIAAVHEGQANRLFVDGKKQSGTTNVTLVRNPEFFHIGRQYSHLDDRYFDGLIDDVRVYSKAMTEEQINQVLAGDPLVASSPAPGTGAIVDIRSADSLRWSAGAAAASHDVYFGTDRKAVVEAGKGSPEFKGNRPGTSLSLAGLVAFGGGDYYWRIDEVEAGGQVRAGYVWKFTVPAYLIVDDFESYTNESPKRIFQTWLDGVGFSPDEFFPNGSPGNGTGAAFGHDIWTPDSPYFERQIMENSIVHGGGQSAPLYYSGLSQIDRTFGPPAQDWTVHGVTTLVVHFRGVRDNPGRLYLTISGTKISYDGDPADIASTDWTPWEIDLASVGVNLTNVTALSIGVEGGEAGLLYLDDIRLIMPEPDNMQE